MQSKKPRKKFRCPDLIPHGVLQVRHYERAHSSSQVELSIPGRTASRISPPNLSCSGQESMTVLLAILSATLPLNRT